MSKALSMTVIFQANALNYGEGMANISELKKFHRANGEVYTFASRQSLRYDIIRIGNQLYGWNLDTVDKSSGVVQFRKDVTIQESVEMDLFGYLKTAQQSEKRPAVVRLSHAVSLEPYRGDMDFLNNMGLAARIGENPNLANIEQHLSFYTYTCTVDLERVGMDGEIRLPAEEKAERVCQLLSILKVLNREIKGRQENLAPLFVIGGLYHVANPFFLGKIRLEKTRDGWGVNRKPIDDTMELTFAGRGVGEQTKIGMVRGIFSNEREFEDAYGDRVMSVEKFFQTLDEQVKEAYGVTNG
ncbi:MAG: type I-B CRISPR-associated protein Cas7/Cst2/DevR [Bacillus thermozeamaize]|uniref:Type I-B CRISPR-associated protein Cas7/Cst2/DevR n=1 Tax=Bacillus thermozeamaize TaxID=230954 RepID=A0A1Y3PW13_9BACI|nr:MAG: type I-B CRISPR-associated protein Cas7/Cst2/DevR [Bacillus thermozeamaize]